MKYSLFCLNMKLLMYGSVQSVVINLQSIMPKNANHIHTINPVKSELNGG